MEAGTIQFDPASEFEIIETLDFEEEIQRPEELRFFTLDEQLNDYNQKVLPAKAKITKFEYQKIAKEIDRIRELYTDVITATAEGYDIDTRRKEVKVDWVKPIYTDFEYGSYSFAESWNPLHTRENVRIPNAYPRMLSALPKPYRTKEGRGVLLEETTEVVNEEGEDRVKTLGTYERTKGVTHEDGSFSVVKLPMTNTSDGMKRKGFYIFPRGVEVPYPLEEHPFLASSQAGKVMTEETLNDVFPSIEAILSHGVPRTADPYGEGRKFLKIYDVKLSQIPWASWSAQFPPVDTIVAAPQVVSVKFPDKEDEPEPSKSLRDFYVVPWMAGLNPRFWLMKQEDGGLVVAKMLLSMAGESGTVPPRLLGETLNPVFTKSTPEECLRTDSFQALLESGVYRNGVCVPAAAIAKERSDFLSAKSAAWKETTPADIIKEHRELLSYFQMKPSKEAVVKYEKYAGRPVSELRKDVVVILKDETRMASDKAEAIQLIVRGNKVVNEVYIDKDDSFVVCAHTLSVLNGDLADDRLAFYEKWTDIDDGFRVCKFCGELVNTDVLIAQDDFDDDGNVIINYDSLGSGAVFHGDGHVESFTNSLLKLKTMFDLNVPGEAVLYLILSLLQILPDEGQLLPVLSFIRELSAVIRMNKKIEKDTKERLEGIMGIVGSVVLLQTHNPFLIPRRSFGSRVLKLSGFPRDTDDASVAPALDLVITVLKTTAQDSPNTFKGAVGTFLRAVISKPKDVRKETVNFLKRAADKFKTQFVAAKDRYVAPTEQEVKTPISLPMVAVTKTVYTPTERIGDEVMGECLGRVPVDVLLPRMPPNVRQQPVPLYKASASPLAEFVQAELEIEKPVTFTEAEIRRRIGLGFPKGIKLPKIEEFLKGDVDGVSIMTLINRILDIVAPTKFNSQKYRVYVEPNSLFRDAAKGLLYEVLHEIAKNSPALKELQGAAARDVVMTMIFLTEEQASKQNSELKAKERDTFRQRLRQMDDTQREATKMLLDIGISDYIITNQDRELFMREYNLPDPDKEYDEMMAEDDLDRPEDNPAGRDVEDDMPPLAADGTTELDADRGEYGDRREQMYGRDYENFAHFDDDEGYGV